MSTDDTAHSWQLAFAKARELGYSAEISVPKRAERSLPRNMNIRKSPPPFSLPKGAKAVYREDQRGDHFQIREYEDHWTVDLDRFNPHYAPARHAMADATQYTALAAGVAAIAFGGSSSG